MEIDQIFVGIHVRCARLVSSLVPRPVRALLQAGSLLLSLFLLTSLIWLHHQHIHPQGTHYTRSHDGSSDASSPTSGSFPSLVEWMQGSDVLRVRIEPPNSDYELWPATGWSGWWNDRDRIAVSRHSYDDQTAHEDETGEQRGAVGDSMRRQQQQPQEVSAEVSAHPSQRTSTFTLRHVNRPPNFSSSPALPLRSHSQSTPQSQLGATATAPLAASPSHVYEYALHKGYFLLPASLYARHRVVTTTVTLSASHRAFGPFPLSFFTYHLYGYDSIVLNHLIRQMRTGFMRSAATNDIYTLSGGNTNKPRETHHTHNTTAQSTSSEQQPVTTLHRLGHLLYLLFFKSELLVTTLFLFFATTTLVSSTLTQTQLRMLHFTDQLRQHIRLHLPIVGLVLEHTMQSLSFVPVVVGILFFLFEFFNDQVLAFLLLMLVWLCESYTVLFTRTATSMLYFPKLFALYFLMFSVYFFSFPYGFHYIAMGLTASQLYTCILYYWFEYEIPAVEAGDISIHRPRMLVLRRADGGEREREEASAGHARGHSDDRSEQAGSAAATGAERGRDSVGQQELSARLQSARDARDVQHPRTSRERAVRANQSALLDDGEANEFEFSRRPLPRISTSSTAAPSRTAVSIGPASAATYSASLLPVPSALSMSTSAPGQAVRAVSGPSSASLVPELFSPLSSASPAHVPTSLSQLSMIPSSALSASDVQADVALQRLQSLPLLLQTLLGHTQQLKAQYAAPASPRRSHSHSSGQHRGRAASSAVSPTLSPLLHSKDETALSLAAISLPGVSLASEESKEQPDASSPRVAAVTAAAGLSNEPGALHKALLDQLSNVLQVALYTLTALVQHPPAATSAHTLNTSTWTSHSATAAVRSVAAAVRLSLPVVGDAAAGGDVGASVADVQSQAMPTSPVSRSSLSPRSSPTPPPRASPPSSHRTSSSFSSPSVTQASVPVRRLLFSERLSAGGTAAFGRAGGPAAVVAGAAGAASGSSRASSALDSEPASPDSASDAPMM